MRERWVRFRIPLHGHEGGVFMAKLKKDTLIKRKRSELAEIFQEINENKRKIAQPLIDTMAFIAVELPELEEKIKAEGWTEEYTNGKNQSGMKKSAAADTYISLTKNFATITKQLLDIVPETTNQGKLKEFLK